MRMSSVARIALIVTLLMTASCVIPMTHEQAMKTAEAYERRHQARQEALGRRAVGGCESCCKDCCDD